MQKDLIAARTAAGQEIHYEVTDTALHDLETDHPVGDVHRRRRARAAARGRRRGRLRRVVRAQPRTGARRTSADQWEKVYPYSWFGILADVAPSTDELIYAWHPDGFALHSMRSATVSRFYLQVPNDTDARRLVRRPDLGGAGDPARVTARTAGSSTSGPITDKSVLPMRSFVQTPMRHGRLFLAGDAAHIVPPTGAKGLNLAVADVALLAPALVDLVRKDDHRLADGYSDTALRRVWRCTHFSWWMTTMLHHSDDPFDEQLQLSQLRWVTSSEAGATGLAENYAGLPIGF